MRDASARTSRASPLPKEVAPRSIISAKTHAVDLLENSPLRDLGLLRGGERAVAVGAIEVAGRLVVGDGRIAEFRVIRLRGQGVGRRIVAILRHLPDRLEDRERAVAVEAEALVIADEGAARDRMTMS